MTAAGVVKIRLSGAAEDIAALAALLEALQANAVAGQVAITAPGGGTVACRAPEVLDTSAGYPNRRETGYRVYLTVRLGVLGQGCMCAARIGPPGVEHAEDCPAFASEGGQR
ncbi:MAG TPA: hypothetical protein VMV92_20365 [Streptosporangiaceae bacterium]|nr:hypothetical protein [Streptosporangiaceae bacterium]